VRADRTTWIDVQQIADIFNVPRTTVYGHLKDSSKGKRPAVQAHARERLKRRRRSNG